jgi:hypothetical protein
MIKQMSFKLDPELIRGAQKAIGAESMTDAISRLCREAVENKTVFDEHTKSFGKFTDWDDD